MWRKGLLGIFIIVAAIVFLMPVNSFAKLSDINNDGKVDYKDKEIKRSKGKAIVDKKWEEKADLNNDGIVDKYELKRWRKLHNNVDPYAEETATETVTATETLPAVTVQTETQPGVIIRHDNDNNPPGSAGGAGTNWENPPGPAGGPGASPDRRGGRR